MPKDNFVRALALLSTLFWVTCSFAVTDYNGDGKADIAFYRPGSTWNTVPVLFSNGDGTWRPTNFPTPAWANQPGVIAVPGDYDGDGKTDIAFYRPGSTWNTVPVLFSNGDGTWRDTNFPAPAWANQPGVIAVPGDYHCTGPTIGEGRCRDDIAFFNPGSTWNTAPVLFSSGDGHWHPANSPAPAWVNQPGVIAVPGQYRCRWRGQLCESVLTDIAFYRPGSTWNTLPMLFSNVDGTWDSDNSLAQDWVNQPGVIAVPGGYVSIGVGGLTGLAFHRPGSTWNTVPVLLHYWDFRAHPPDWWSAYNNPAPAWANQPGVIAVAGDYDGDLRADIAFYRPGSTWNTVPVLFSNGDGTWRPTNFPAPDWASQPGVVAVQSNYSFGVPAAPSLSFNPPSATVALGNSQSATVNIPNATSNPVTVSLNPANANVSVAGVPPGTQAAAIIPQGATTSPTISIQGVQAGSSTVTASAAGFQNAVLNVTVSSPPQSFSLALAGPNQDVHFGDNASFTVTLTPVNGFMGMVALSTPNQPSLTQGGWIFSPSSSIDASSSNLSRTLHGTITPSLFSPGPNRAVVQGVAANGLQASAMGTLMVAHSQGDFIHVYPQPQVPAAAQTDCVDGTAHVHISFTNFGTNDFRIRFTRTDLPGMPATADTPAVFFLYSQQHCRIGVALNGVGLQQMVSLFDLGFIAVPGWDIRNAHLLPANALRQQYWFSQDESLLVAIRVIGQTPAARLPPGTQPGTIWDYGALLIDPITGRQIGSEQQFSSLTLVADIKEMQAEANGMQFNMNQNGMLRDPDPDPNQAAPVIADIYKIELVRDPGSGALQAEGTFRILNGQLDGLTFEQESARYPDHFGKFVLRVP